LEFARSVDAILRVVADHDVDRSPGKLLAALRRYLIERRDRGLAGENAFDAIGR
jgi:hypothetical protein